MVTPFAVPNESFKTYKEKVVYILQTVNDNFESSSELNWCLHVIKNDFLQISNSKLMGAGRRFSKT